MLVASTPVVDFNCATPAASALRERGHRGLAGQLVAVRRRAVLMVAKGERPQPRRAFG
jgi:hypothetical protein